MKKKLKISQTEENQTSDNLPSEAIQMDISSFDENGNLIEEKTPREDESAEETLCRMTTYSPEDLQMLIDAGFETELYRFAGADGKESVKRYRAEKLLEKDEQSIAKLKKGSRNHVGAILSHAKGKFIFVLCMEVLFFLMTLLCSDINFFERFLTFIPSMYVPFASMGAQTVLMLLYVLLTAPIFANPLSAHRYFSKTITNGHMILYAVSFVYSALISAQLYPRNGVLSPVAYLPVAPFVFFLFFLFSINYYLRFCADIRSFTLMNQSGKKVILHPQNPRKIKVKKGNRFIRVKTEYANNRFYRIEKTYNVTGLYDHAFPQERPKGSSHFLLFFAMLFAFGFTFSTALFSYDELSVNAFLTSVTTFFTTFFMVFPSYFLFGLLFPYSHVNALLYKKNSTFLGEDTVSVFEKNKIIVFNDDELIAVKKIQETSLTDDASYKRAKRYANLLFKKLGGSLSKIFPKESQKENCAVVSLTDCGVKAVIGEKECYLGSASYIQSMGITLPTSPANTIPTKNQVENYFVVDGEVCIYYLFDYSLTDFFGKATKRVALSGFRLAVYTFDPNLNFAFVNLLSNDVEKISSCVKLPQTESRKSLLACNAGIASLNDSYGIMDALFGIRNVVKVRKVNFFVSACFTFLSAIAVVVSHLLGMKNLISISSIMIFQMIALFAVFFMTKLLCDNDFADYTPEEQAETKEETPTPTDSAEVPILTIPEQQSENPTPEEVKPEENNKEENQHAE